MDATAEFTPPMGFGEPDPGIGTPWEGRGDLLDAIVEWFPKPPAAEDIDAAVSIAIVGRPNVGKSSLVNSLVGSPRSIVRDDAGTTRDAIDTPIVRDGQTILLIDTARIRPARPRSRRASRSTASCAPCGRIRRADVARPAHRRDRGRAGSGCPSRGYVDEAAKGLVVAVNKWDLAEKHPRAQQEYTEVLRQELKFADWARWSTSRPRPGQRVDPRRLAGALAIQAERTKRIPTPQLNDVIPQGGRKPPAQRPRAHAQDLLLSANRHLAANVHLFLQRPADDPLQLRALPGQHAARTLRLRRHPIRIEFRRRRV